MITRILASAVVAAVFCGPALAAQPAGSADNSSAASGTNTSSQANTATAPAIGAKLRQSLTSAGFTDVRVMPESFLVHAKDSDGNPVMMVVNPDSVAAVTAVGGSSGGNNGSGTGTAGNGSAANNTANQHAENSATPHSETNNTANHASSDSGRQQ